MLNYLWETRPDILYSVHQCSRFCNNPHEKAIKCIIGYLKCTPNEGNFLSPDSSKGIQCYVDADFASGWNASDCEDPSSVYSRTGYVIMFAGCSVVWVSKLQTEVTLSTTEAEYIALRQAMRDLIPLLSLLDELTPALHLEKINLQCIGGPVVLSQILTSSLLIYMKIIQVPMNLQKHRK